MAQVWHKWGATMKPAPDTATDTVSARNFQSDGGFGTISTPRLEFVSPPSRRLPKFTRAKHSWRPPLVLQERDLTFLRAAADCRLLSTPQYLLLFPESRDAVYRRLQLLFHHGYLDRLGGNPSAPMVYALATRGAEILVERGYLKDAGDWRKRNQDLRDRYIAHQAMITNFRITLTLATRERPGIRLLFFRREGLDLRDRVIATGNGRRQTLPINPDGFFGLQFPELPEGRNRAFFFLEADRSTMTRERFVQKLMGYWEWFSQGGHTRKHGIRSFRVLTVTKSEERTASLNQAAGEAEDLREGLRIFWFTSEKRFTPDQPASVFEPIWETSDRPGTPKSILPQASITADPAGVHARSLAPPAPRPA